MQIQLENLASGPGLERRAAGSERFIAATIRDQRVRALEHLVVPFAAFSLHTLTHIPPQNRRVDAAVGQALALGEDLGDASRHAARALLEHT